MKLSEIILCLVLVFSSCTINSNLQKIEYPLNKKKAILKIPKGFNFSHISGGGEWDRYECTYKDSSILYITNDDDGGLNYANIDKQSGGKLKLFNALDTRDSFTLQGVDSNRLYWKHVFSGKISIGYLRVSDKRKLEFNKALSSLIIN